MNSLQPDPRHRRQSGFGLLEVLVSLVIFASVGFTLLAWLQQSTDTAFRLRTFYQLQDARKTALELVRTVNPMQKPKGTTTLGSLRISWDCVVDGEARIQAGYPAGTGRYRLQLYTTTLSVFRGDEIQPWFVETLTLIGYRLDGAPAPDSLGGLNG